MEINYAFFELINQSARLMENGEWLELIETETAIIESTIVELLQSRFEQNMDLTIFSTKMNSGELWREVNAKLKFYLNSEYNPH